MEDDENGQKVQLYIYDLTKGMAAMMSGMLLGRQIDGIWHTAVVVFGREFFFGGQGIESCAPVSICALRTLRCWTHISCTTASVGYRVVACKTKAPGMRHATTG